jgi:IS30 family transposase
MTHLTTNERYQIEHDLRLGLSTAQIAQAMGRSIRTIQRELSNNGGRHTYDARQAIDKRRERARISSKNHPSIEDAVWEKVLNRVKCKLSPDQAIVVENLSISISAVYRHLHRTKKIELLRHLRHYSSTPRRGTTGWVKHAKPIKQRPREVLTRDCIGHMETDSIVGKRNEHHKILVTIDRATRYVRLGWVRDGSSKTVACHFERWMKDERLPILSITTDRGSEFAGLPRLFTDNLYACDPGKPYQKGAVENMNGLIRQYIAKGKSLRRVTQAQLNYIANELNNRPRKRLGYRTPAQLLSEMTAARQFER